MVNTKIGWGRTDYRVRRTESKGDRGLGVGDGRKVQRCKSERSSCAKVSAAEGREGTRVRSTDYGGIGE